METIRIAQLSIRAGDSVLDLGCGEGRHSIALNYHHPECKVIGLDLNFDDLKQAKRKHDDFCRGSLQNAPSSTVNYSYLQSDGTHLPFADKSFDHVICSEVLEHIPDYEDFLKEIERITKDGAGISISVPRAWPEKICWMLSRAYHQVEGGHIRIFNSRDLQETLSHYGFERQEKHWAHALHSVYWWLRCAHWNDGKDNAMSKIYHKLLVWDLMKRPALTQNLERLLNPILGKSVVLYFKKSRAK